MATKDFQQSPSSQPQPSKAFPLEMEGDTKEGDNVVQPQNQPISDAPPQLPQPINDQEPKEKKEKKMYPCRYCDKTFSSPMAFGGYQNGGLRLSRLKFLFLTSPTPTLSIMLIIMQVILPIQEWLYTITSHRE